MLVNAKTRIRKQVLKVCTDCTICSLRGRPMFSGDQRRRGMPLLEWGRRFLVAHCITSTYTQTLDFFLCVVIDVSLLSGAKSKASQGTNV